MKRTLKTWTGGCLASIGALLLAASGPSAPALAQAPAAASCAPANGLSFVCGLDNAEDLVVAPGGRWIVASALKDKGAGLYVIDARARVGKPAELAMADKVGAAPFAGCPAPDFKAMRTHGIELRPGKGTTHTVYAINHAPGREAIEVFSLDTAGAWPSLRWTGCIILPADVSPNSLAAMPGGRLAVTKFNDASDADGFVHILQGQITGSVLIWTPGQGFKEVPGSRFSGDNGILVSPDGKTIYVCDYGQKAVRRISVDGSGQPASVSFPYRPDNLRWDTGGRILVAGQFVDVSNRNGPHGWGVDLIDPKTMTATEVKRAPGRPEFDNSTTAVRAGGQIWLGTFRGDRVAYMPAPK